MGGSYHYRSQPGNSDNVDDYVRALGNAHSLDEAYESAAGHPAPHAWVHRIRAALDGLSGGADVSQPVGAGAPARAQWKRSRQGACCGEADAGVFYTQHSIIVGKRRAEARPIPAVRGGE